MICAAEGCMKRDYCKGLCTTHYKRQWRHGDMKQTARYEGKPCAIEGCQEPARRNDYCSAHSARISRHGTPDLVRRANGTGTTTNGGYRLLTVDGRRVYEHIHKAEKALGRPLPKGAIVHHMNKNTLDNDTPFNLIICPNQEYHMLIHARMRAFNYNG